MVYFASTYILQSTLIEVRDASMNRFEEGGVLATGGGGANEVRDRISQLIFPSFLAWPLRCWLGYTYPLQVCILAGSVIDRTRHVGWRRVRVWTRHLFGSYDTCGRCHRTCRKTGNRARNVTILRLFWTKRMCRGYQCTTLGYRS